MPDVTLSEVPVAFDPEGVARLGLVALSTDLTFERDAARLIPNDRAALYVARVRFDNPTTPENLARMGPRLAEAADLILPDIPLKAICYACTSASVTLGDAFVKDAIGSVRPGVPLVTPPDAAVQGLAALAVRRMALVTPYLPETTKPMAAYFEARGLEVVSAQCLGLADDRDMARVTADTIIAAAETADRPDAEAVFLSCTALPALGVIAELESRLGKPVLSSNQACLWRMLHHAGLAPASGAPGRLFSAHPAEATP